MPSLNIDIMSISLAPVESVCSLPGNNTEVNAPVLDPVPSCLIISETLWPVARLLKLKVAECASVTLKTGARLQSTAMVVAEVSACISSV